MHSSDIRQAVLCSFFMSADEPHPKQAYELATVFRPTERQRRMRDFVMYFSVKYGAFRIYQWLEAARHEVAFRGNPVGKREFELWHDEPGFTPWFYEYLDISRISDIEQNMLDNLFWAGLAEGMHKREPWAFGTYARARIDERDRPPTEAQAEDTHRWLGGQKKGPPVKRIDLGWASPEQLEILVEEARTRKGG